MRAYERFLKYIAYPTASCEDSADTPSTDGQKALGKVLVEEMKDMGVTNAFMDEKGYVYGSVPENVENQPAIGLIAHMDTVDSVPWKDIKARIVPFEGTDVPLNDGGEALSVKEFPFLKKYAGKHLIVSDGRTLLGADDKAGIAEIMTLLETLASDDGIRHGKVCVCFTPDEEIGRGADSFDVEGFGADFAYTIDGGEIGELEYENFNAASACITVRGVNIHPGSAKGKMKNAVRIAAEFMNLLPEAESPEHTEGYEGFYHATDVQGGVEKTTLHLIVRDHDREKFENRKKTVKAIAEFLNGKYGVQTVEAEIRDSYYNMADVLKDKRYIVDRAEAAMRQVGITPVIGPIRGGTDGARLSFMGLACPNLSTGGMNFHSKRECVVLEAMDDMVSVLTNIVRAPN